MLNRINIYLFTQIIKSCALIFFIFISIAWLLQLTRLFSLTNLVQIDIFNVIFLSFFLIPNLITVIIPFIIIFGILLCFIKLSRDKEIIAIYSLGMDVKPFKLSIITFCILILFLQLSLNSIISPVVYEKYKLKEFELRNTIDFNRMITSNFLDINKSTTIDFQKKNDYFENIFINFIDENENIIFAKKGYITNKNNEFIFQLNDGFKLSLNKNKEIEKLKFTNYIFKINSDKKASFVNYDRNSLTIFDDYKNKDYLNISFKVFDTIFCLLIIYLFYINNILSINFSLKNNLSFILFSIIIIILNQLLKNSETDLNKYLLYSVTIIIISISIISIKKKYEQS